MKHAVRPMLFALALVTAPLIFAQDTPQTAPAAQQGTTAAPTHMPNPHRQAIRLARQLNLTPEQTARVEPILADRDGKITAMRSDQTMAPVVAQARMREIQRNSADQLRAVLTPAQFDQLKSSHRKARTAPQPTPQQATPQP